VRREPRLPRLRSPVMGLQVTLPRSLSLWPARQLSAGVTFSCSPADGSAVVFVLSFASRPEVDVWHARTDCPAPSNRKITALVTTHASDLQPASRIRRVKLGGSVIPEAAPSRLCPVRSGPRAPDEPIMPGGCSAWRDPHPLHTGGNLRPSTRRLKRRAGRAERSPARRGKSR